MREIQYTLVGLGNIGRNLLHVLAHRAEAVATQYGVRFTLVGAADSSGAAIDPTGLDLLRLRDIKLGCGSAATYPLVGRPGMSALEMVQSVNANLLVDASPTNLQDGQPGLDCTRHALGVGQDVVAANKARLSWLTPS